MKGRALELGYTIIRIDEDGPKRTGDVAMLQLVLT